MLMRLSLAHFLLLQLTAAAAISRRTTSSGTADDYNGIRQTLAHYAVALDAKDFAGFDRVFTEDVFAAYGPGPGDLNGLQQLKEGVEKAMSPVTSQHALTTQLIDLHDSESGRHGNGSSSANSTTFFTSSLFGTGEYEGEIVYAYGKYEDELVKLGGGADADGVPGTNFKWRIKGRAVLYMGPFTGNASILGL
ncbi:MAG: hypothetical protein M1837_007511 [Sclerophora amabilis]|nr:MAG: hypothetical protein M1837_007511 [Sclerophora amabilis]